MSNAPYLLRDARFGYRFGDGALVDAMIYDGLLGSVFSDDDGVARRKVARRTRLHARSAGRFALEPSARGTPRTTPGISPTRSCRCASRPKPKASRRRRAAASGARARPGRRRRRRAGDLGSRAVRRSLRSITNATRRSSPATYPARSSIATKPCAPTRPRSDGKLRPLDKDGTITAGNAPGVNDGAAALILADAEYAPQHGLRSAGEIVDHACVAWDPPYLCAHAGDGGAEAARPDAV